MLLGALDPRLVNLTNPTPVELDTNSTGSNPAPVDGKCPDVEEPNPGLGSPFMTHYEVVDNKCCIKTGGACATKKDYSCCKSECEGTGDKGSCN